MKLICDACKLTLNARDEDRGKPFQCPICHAALRDADAPKATNGADAKASGVAGSPGLIEWSGGTIDDLIYMISSQALAAVVEVHAPDKRGEVYLIAGGVDEAYAGELRGDEALESMRQLPTPRFRVEMRLPNEETGSLATPGPDKGDLKTRPLAQLMRYCESFVLTCDLEVWRANETCKVEYRQGNIARSLVGGVDAPEQLGEVMGWTAGNYRFVLPRLALPQMDDAARAQAKAAAETKLSDQKAARKTIFGMPAPAMAAAMAGPGPGGAAAGGGGANAPAQPVSPAVMMSAQAPSEPAAQTARPANATMIGMPSMIPQTNRAASSPANPNAKPAPANVVVEEAYTTAAKAKPAADPAKTVAASPAAGKRSQPPASQAQAKASQPPASKAAAAKSRPPATDARRDQDEELEAPPSKMRIGQYVALSIGVAGIAWLVVYWLLSN